MAGERILSRAVFIHDCYSRFLGRPADTIGFESLHASPATEAEIEQAFINGKEHQAIVRLRAEIAGRLAGYPTRKKLLMFSAYGNGNLGDAIQPAAIANDVEERFDVVVFAYSELSVLNYPFPEERKLNPSPEVAFGPLNPLILQLFDGLILGGGGLLAHPHTPIWNPHWAHTIPIPYAIWSCGVSNPSPPEVENLVALASAVSGRDVESVNALKVIRDDVVLCPDPVLATLKLSIETSGKGRAFIVRGPVRDVHAVIREELNSDDIVLGMEPGVDWPLIDVFPRIQFVTSIDLLQRLLADREEVISERYHGVITALLLGKSAYGLTRSDHNESKIVEIFRTLGAPSYCDRMWQAPSEPFPYEAAKQLIFDSQRQYQSSTKLLVNALVDSGSVAGSSSAPMDCVIGITKR